MAVRSSLGEQETIFRWDREEGRLHLCTANPQEAERWRRKGIRVRVLGTAGGEPRSWEGGPISVAALSLRRVNAEGEVIKRKPGGAALARMKG